MSHSAHILIDGRVVSSNQLEISPLDPIFQHGHGVFETLHVFDGRPLFLSQHYRRLCFGLSTLGIQVPFEEAKFQALLEEILAVNALITGEARLKIIVGSRMKGPPLTICTAERYLPSDLGQPFALWLPARTGQPPLASFKTLSYAYHCLLHSQAAERGYQDAILRGFRGSILETTRAALMIHYRDIWWIPPAHGRLESISQTEVVASLQRLGMECRTRTISPEMFRAADTVWCTNVLRLIQPVHRINSVPTRYLAMSTAELLRTDILERQFVR